MRLEASLSGLPTFLVNDILGHDRLLQLSSLARGWQPGAPGQLEQPAGRCMQRLSHACTSRICSADLSAICNVCPGGICAAAVQLLLSAACRSAVYGTSCPPQGARGRSDDLNPPDRNGSILD